MADENKPAFYPRVGNIKAKNFKSAQPMPFVEDPRAMDLPQYGDIDLSIPTKENLEMGRRMAERDAQLRRQQQADRSPLEKLAGGVQAGRLMGSALAQSVASIPTALRDGSKAAEEYIAENMYKPTQPLAYEYAQDVGDFLEKLETQYKIPPILPEAMALQFLTGPGTSQAARAADKGTERASRALERRMEPVVTGALEQGGLPREMALGMGQGTQSNIIKPVGGNWKPDSVENAVKQFKRTSGYSDPAELLEELRDRYTPEVIAGLQEDSRNHVLNSMSMLEKDVAINNWVDTNLTNYITKQMGTEKDPVRLLADQGITHFADEDAMRRALSTSYDQFARNRKVRKNFDMPEAPMAQTSLGRTWEEGIDDLMGMTNIHRAKNFGNPYLREKNPWLNKLDPETKLYGIDELMPRQMNFGHIMDVLREDLASGRMSPADLKNVSMDRAVRRTAEYDQEKAKRMAETALKEQTDFPVLKEYPEGYKWLDLSLPKDEMMPEGYNIVRNPDVITPKDGAPYLLLDPEGKAVAFGDSPGDIMRGIAPDMKPGYGKLKKALDYEGNVMGHCVGSYCDEVSGGGTKIYSLRDKKGEPHVTIEVQPDTTRPRVDQIKRYMAAAEEEAKQLPQGYTNRDVTDIATQMAIDNAPPSIVQIKGKQNRAPKDEYLPFVQDFVRSREWNEINDLHNTGLQSIDDAFPEYEMAKYFSRAYPSKSFVNQKEIDDFTKEWKSLGGMKAGGKVSISKNPDTMMLEVNNQKMKNGEPAYGAGKAVTKQSLKAAKPEVMKASEALGKIEGRPLKITQADRTKVGGGYLGGPGFSGLQLTEPEYRAAEAAWAVQNAGTAKTILGGGKADDNAVYAAMIGTPTQHQSNQMVFDKLYGDFKKAAKRGELTPELRDMINMRLAAAVDKKGNPVFPSDVDIMDKKFRDIADTFSRRSIAGHLMGGVQVGGKKGQIIDYDKIIRNTTDPALIDLPTGSIGNRLFTLSGGIIDRPDLHPAFPAILQGEDLGLTFSPVERDIVMKDFVAKTMREKGRKPGYMDYSRGNPPTQLITEDILTEMQKLGLKKGGAVKKAEGGYLKKPAAYINGDEFVNAAKKYGIKDSMNNLNKIVDLVNKGLSVDDAARQVADSGMHKAAGGAISGDDLIIEERPL